VLEREPKGEIVPSSPKASTCVILSHLDAFSPA